ncbi:MAG TPA: SH3 domain-containing protein, partial [Anaerolineales bacterium]|nr:SH3 domain-containing protein [Anaerolineales bacterium]
MTNHLFVPRLCILFIGILLLVSCAPVATTVGTTPTTPPTTTAPAAAVQISTSTPIPEIEVGVVEVDLLNFREGPGTNYPILGSLVKGEKFYILSAVVNSTNNTWLLINPTPDSF